MLRAPFRGVRRGMFQFSPVRGGLSGPRISSYIPARPALDFLISRLWSFAAGKVSAAMKIDRAIKWIASRRTQQGVYTAVGLTSWTANGLPTHPPTPPPQFHPPFPRQ